MLATMINQSRNVRWHLVHPIHLYVHSFTCSFIHSFLPYYVLSSYYGEALETGKKQLCPRGVPILVEETDDKLNCK